MTMHPRSHRQQGVTLIELMVTMAITLFLVAAAAYVYLGTRETQRAIERNSSNIETGSFAMQLMGQEIMKAGFYPATISRPPTADEGFPKITYYPPIRIAQNAAQSTDWTAPTTATAGIYLSGIFGCDGGKFLPATGACDTSVANASDSIVINYFTNDNLGTATQIGNVGDGRDCVGNAVSLHPSNTNRLNTVNTEGPPLQPLFVSNRYALVQTVAEIDKQVVNTASLACNGSGASAESNIYQPLLAGIEEMHFTYGVFAVNADTGSRTPEKFYNAAGVSGLGSVMVDNGMFQVLTPPWSRVSAVRVCIIAKSQGGTPKIADKAGAARTYLNCDDVATTPTTDVNALRKRFVQVFTVRNRMNVVF